MKKTLTALAIAFLGTLCAGSSFAYQITRGEDPNGNPTIIPPFPNSTNAQLRFFGRSTLQVENFENQTVGPGPLTLVFGSSNTAVSATLSGGNGGVQSLIGNPTDGRFSVPGGNKFWAATATSSGDTFNIAFSANVEAFGFFGIDIGDFGGTLSMELLNAAGNMMGTGFPVNTGTGSSRDGSVLYFGIRADNPGEWFRGIRFRLTNTTTQLDAFAFDSFTVVGAPRTTPPGQIPEPGTLALIGLALLASSLVRRRA